MHGCAALAGQSLLHLLQKTSDLVTQLSHCLPSADVNALAPSDTQNAALSLVLGDCLWGSSALHYHSQGQGKEVAQDARLARQPDSQQIPKEHLPCDGPTVLSSGQVMN